MFSPRWPPIPITINGGIKPSLGHLVKPIQDKFSDLSLDNIMIYKYQSLSNEWQFIRSPPNLTSSSSASNNPKAITKANTAVMDSIKENDLLCVFSANDLLDPSVSSSLSSQQKSSLLSDVLKNLHISLPEDLYIQKMKQELKQASPSSGSKKANGKSNGKGGKSVQWLSSHLQNKLSSGDTGPKFKRKEYALTLRGDFDSSDEEVEQN
jgi:hypothetical protein